MFSDCGGALIRVAELPPRQIPTQYKHSYVLKNILVNCADLSFGVRYSHVPVHQYDHEAYDTVRQPAQFNCLCNGKPKEVLWGWVAEGLPPEQVSPLEPLSVYVGPNKLTTATEGELGFSHKQLEESEFVKLGMLSAEQFHQIAWRQV